MAVSRISNFNWEKVLSKLHTPEAKRATQVLRASANELLSQASKYGQKPAEIDFAAYKQKLRFTSSAVDSLEKIYKARQLPNHFAAISDFHVKKREVTASVLARIVEARKLDIAELNAQVVELENFKIDDETSAGDIRNRFPEMAREVELQIKNHEWAGVKN